MPPAGLRYVPAGDSLANLYQVIVRRKTLVKITSITERRGYRPDYLRALAQRVEVAAQELRSFVSKWRARSQKAASDDIGGPRVVGVGREGPGWSVPN
jgi:hypothetical protein